jgi:hypothetical protein
MTPGNLGFDCPMNLAKHMVGKRRNYRQGARTAQTAKAEQITIQKAAICVDFLFFWACLASWR